MTEDAPKDTARPAIGAGSSWSTGKMARLSTSAPMSGDLYHWEWKPLDKLAEGDTICVYGAEMKVEMAHSPLGHDHGDFWYLEAFTIRTGSYLSIWLDRNTDILTRVDPLTTAVGVCNRT